MLEVIEKSRCTGCSACSQVCPKNCIDMTVNNEGFLEPLIDQEKCIDCYMCRNVCPVINGETILKDTFPNTYLMYDNNEEIRFNSAAGGGFSCIARHFIDKYNAVVFGATYDENYKVKHTYIEKLSDLKKIQKSKYVQSDMGNMFSIAKDFIKEGRYVLFSGTPCQIYGLKSFLVGINQEKLYCVDLSCHGVPSPKVFEKYLNYLEEENNSKIEKFVMRDKEIIKNRYNQGFGIKFENGKKYFNSHNEDLFGRCFWGEIASRQSCFDCEFKTVWRVADITVGDCWYFSCFVPSEKDKSGVTLAFAHSDKGNQIIKSCKDLVYYQIADSDIENIIKVNGGMIYSSAIPNPNRKEFFEKLDTVDFKKLVKGYFPDKHKSRKDVYLEKLERKGIQLEFLRKISRKNRLNQIVNEANLPKEKIALRDIRSVK